MFEITDDDIAFSESILLKEGQHFDDERREFIRDFGTLDLQAVPGSGKTTALLAKLLILERYMPLLDGRGVLVISHTNTAVDEIKERIGKHCPRLFRYPNFVGTIQSFVDTFLAIPHYTNHFKTKPYRIDNEIYDEQVEKFYATTENVRLKYYLDQQYDGLGVLKSIRLNSDRKLIKYLDGTPESFKPRNENTPTYKSLHNFKMRMLENGYIHFDDAYTLANFQISNVPDYPSLLQKRFQYVFVDEMQDMDAHQIDLLEAIFFDGGESESNFQRIGDTNQAIFNGSTKHEESIWGQRENIKYLSGSHRLNSKIATVVQRLGLAPNPVVGLKRNDDGTEISIKPTLILYKDATRGEVVPEFSRIIRQHQSDGVLPTEVRHKFAAVAWRKEHSDTDKVCLADYWDEYSTTFSKNRVDFDVLEDYLLFYDRSKKTLESVRKNILNALLKILRLEAIIDENGRHYTKRKLINYIKSLEGNSYEVFKLKLFRWCLWCIQGNQRNALRSIRKNVPHFLSIFEKPMDNASAFVNGASLGIQEDDEVSKYSNTYESDGIRVEVGTIHSMKGQTHTATLYLETYFDRGYGNYESERLRNQILGTEDVGVTLNRETTGVAKIKQSAKMAYVGFSRPTHLLCLAVHEDRFNSVLSEIDRDSWDINDHLTK